MTAHETELMQRLHEEHAKPLWYFCLHLTGNDQPRAEDVLQETLLRAWRHPSILDEPSPALRSWLFTVARHLVIDEWRTKRARSEFPVADVPEREVDDRTDQVLLSWVVGDALARLSPEHRAVLRECYFRGRPVSEAASILGIPEGTVKSRLFLARQQLKERLQGMTSSNAKS